MKNRIWISLSVVLVTVLAMAGCQQQATDATPTPPDIVPAAPDASGSALDGYPAPLANIDLAYPGPDNVQAYPGPDVNGQPVPGAPVEGEVTGEPGTEAPTTGPATPPVGNGQSGFGAPVVPVITESEAAVTALPEAGVFAPPAGASDIASGSTVQHTVIRGDWLLQVARCYGTTYEAVRDANSLAFPDYIKPGMILTVPNVGSVGPIIGAPCVVEYTVQPGDTWEGLAAAYDTSVEVLQRVNPGPLTVGQIIFVPSTSPAGATLPTLTHHLVFNFAGDLAVWRATDSLVELTIEAPVILDLATNGAGRYVLVRQTRDEGLSEEIALIDTVSRTSAVVESGLPTQPADWPGSPADRLHVSPDGTWAVYVVEDASAYRLTSFQTSAPGTQYSVIGIPNVDPTSIAGAALSDGMTDTSFIVSDANGISEYPYSLDRDAHRIVTIDRATMEPANAFFNVTPVPGGQYLLALGGFFEGAAQFVIDAQTGAYGILPNSGAYVVSGTTFATTDGHFVVASPTQVGTTGPQWVTYDAVTTSDSVEFTVLGETITPTLTEAAATDPMPGYVMGAPDVQDSGLPYSIAITGSPAEQGVWRTHGDGAGLQKLNEMPTGPMSTTWVPDVSGVLVTTFQTDLGTAGDTYVSTTGEPLLSLSDWLGSPISDPYWVRQ